MATTASAWAKPGAWALDAEQEDNRIAADPTPAQAEDPAFPSLATAVTTKVPKKKKQQTVSLAEFTSGKPVGYGAAARRVEAEKLVLPTAPRERTEEEISRARYGGGGFRDENRWPARRGFDEPRDLAPSRADGVDDWGAGKSAGGFGDRRGYGGFDRPERDLAPSRADEVEDWGARKSVAPVGGGGFGERRGSGYGGFDRPERDVAPSRADEVDDWGAGKRFAPPPPPAGDRRDLGFSKSDGVDDWTAGKKSAPVVPAPALDSAERWGRREEPVAGGVAGGGRRRLVLQPRTLPIGGGEGGSNGKAKGPSPFGDARPREEILAEKGQDWRKIDEKLETMRVKDAVVKGVARHGAADESPERSWRKAELVDDASSQRSNSEDVAEGFKGEVSEGAEGVAAN